MDQLQFEGDKLKDINKNIIHSSDIVVIHKPEYYGEIGYVMYDEGYLYVCFNGQYFVRFNAKDVEVIEVINKAQVKLAATINLKDNVMTQYTIPTKDNLK